MEPAAVSTHHEDRPSRGSRSSGRSKGSGLTVTQWFWLAFTAVLVGVCALAVAGGQLVSQTAAKSDALVDRIQPARADAYRLQKALIDQETGMRGYALTRDPRWLEPYTQGQKEAGSAARAMRSALADRPGLLDSLAGVQRLADDWRTGHAEPLVEQARKGRAAEGVTAELQASKSAFDRLRGSFAVLNEDLLTERNTAKADLRRTRAGHNWLFGGMLAGFLVIAGALAALLHIAVGRPLSGLRVASQHVADGEFSRRIEPGGPADVRQVAASVEAMRVRVLAALEASQAREQLLAQRTADLDDQAVELRRSNAELEQFAYVASHDLQEPLRKVASFCQLLEKRYGEQLDERAKQYIDFAVDGAKRMQVLINDLLTYSRVGRVNDTREQVELDTAVDEALVNLGAALEEADASIERPGQLHPAMGDPTLLTMLWQNLIGNAVKFRSPDRAPVIGITVEYDASDEEPAWRYSVTDNGIGIPEEFSEKVFVIFQRLHGRDTYTGTGIGLALCKKIVEHHGGRIWIDTAHTDGTRIHFTLPVVPGEDGRPQPDDGEPAHAATPLSTGDPV
ncbi:CHASE3 domain-containing protein [Streptomyces sp. NPDC057445]|uniref:sensor histidine kinase n=1 Tax=Streptomyces sp. NPDC057445 TaxID=3346136 RepID=UPI0036A28FBD